MNFPFQDMLFSSKPAMILKKFFWLCPFIPIGSSLHRRLFSVETPLIPIEPILLLTKPTSFLRRIGMNFLAGFLGRLELIKFCPVSLIECGNETRKAENENGRTYKGKIRVCW